jgi:hypothetical protein
MSIQRIGTRLLLVGAISLAIAAVLLAVFGGIGHPGAPQLFLAAGLTLLGTGGAAVVAGGPLSFGNTITRVGVGILSFGLISMSGFAFGVALTQADVMRNAPLLVMGSLGYLAIPLGLLTTAISAAWRALRRRPV